MFKPPGASVPSWKMSWKMADELDIFSDGKKFRVASIQHLPSERKDQNLQRLQQLIHEAAKKGAKLIVLPEFATTLAPNSEDDFRNFAEEIPGPSTDLMSKSAKDPPGLHCRRVDHRERSIRKALQHVSCF